MKQISNWVFGSFFRTIGRLLVFVLLGVLIANFVDFGNLKDNFSITNLLGIEKVSALTYTQDIKLRVNNWLNITNTSDWTDSYPFYIKTIGNNDNVQTFYLNFDSNAENFVANYDLIGIDFNISQPIRNLQTSYQNDNHCEEWEEYYDNMGGHGYQCKSWNSTYGTIYEPYIVPINELNFSFVINYSGQWNNNWSSCNLENGTIYCPTYKRTVKNIEIKVNFRTAETTNTKIGILRGYKVFDYDNTAAAVQEQTQQQQQQHNETQSYLEDSNTTQAENDASDFFSDFEVEDHGGLSGIITAPLSTIQSLLNNTCTNLVLPLPFVNSNLTLPCMNSIYTEHFGAFFTIYQTIILAIISYRCLRSLFYDVRGFINPDDDRIEVMDL